MHKLWPMLINEMYRFLMSNIALWIHRTRRLRGLPEDDILSVASCYGEQSESEASILLRSKKLVHYITMYLPLAISIGLLIFPPATELIQIDSPSYIDFHISRTIGYPAFLWVFKKITGSLHYIPFIQLIFYTAGCTFLARRLYHLQPTRLGLLLILLAIGLMMGHPEIINYHFQVMSESLSLSILLFLLGLWIDFSQNPRPQTLITISLLIGVGILLRPSGYASISLLALALWVLRTKAFLLRSWLAAVVVPVVLMIFVGSAANRLIHGFWGTQSFLGHLLIGKVTFVMRKDVVTPEPEKYQQLYQAVIPIQKVIAQIPQSQPRQLLRAPYYDVVRYQLLDQIFPPPHDWNTVWRDIAFAVIKDNPVGYLKDILENYTTLWVYPQATSYENSAQFLAYFEKMRPLPYMDRYPFTLRGVPAWFALFFHLCFALAFLISIYSLIGVLLASKYRWIRIAAGGSWLIHSHYFLTACVQAGLTRYAVSLWPAIVFICTIFLMQGIHHFSKQDKLS